MKTTPASTTVLPDRLSSLDAYRGFVMLLMMGEVLAFRSVAQALPESGFWRFLAHHQSHVEWIGCSLHDMIQPSFSFLVGAALPFSLARRAAAGQCALAIDVSSWNIESARWSASFAPESVSMVARYFL